MINLVGWLQNETKKDSACRLRCRCGLHVYKWSWRHLSKECVYCKKRKGV